MILAILLRGLGLLALLVVAVGISLYCVAARHGMRRETEQLDLFVERDTPLRERHRGQAYGNE